VIVFDFFVFALSVFFFITIPSFLTLITKRRNSSLKENESTRGREKRKSGRAASITAEFPSGG
jgi:hypothetical protein